MHIAMSETTDQKTSLKEELTPKRLLVLGLTFLLMAILMLYGWSTNCFAMFLIGIGLYMIPKLVGVKNIKVFTVYGIVFTLVVLLLGTFVMSPAAINDNSTPVDMETKEKDYKFTDIRFDTVGEVTTITAVITGDIGAHSVIFRTYEVVGVGYTIKQTAASVSSDVPMAVVANPNGTHSVSCSKTLDSSKFHAGIISVTKTDGGNEVFNKDTASYLTFIKDPYKGNLTELSFYGVFMCTVFTVILFFLVLFLSAFTKSRLEKTRAKMEAEGRLYPQGYGKCESCNAVVLPGEVNCRKCGAYIDRPDSMKPNKADYFTCSDCGAEVRSDATECPRCGAAFDEEDEIEVIHADGNVDVTTKTFNCSECGLEVPETAEFCPRCGLSFKNL